jgi:hypothetical protein
MFVDVAGASDEWCGCLGQQRPMGGKMDILNEKIVFFAPN